MGKNLKIPELDKLFQGATEYRKSSRFKEILDFAGRFPKIAPFNSFLVQLQKPGSLFVASRSEWKRKYDRYVHEDAQPIIVLKPFSPVAFLYELSDTFGKPFPEEFLNPFKIEGEVPFEKHENLLKNLACDGIFCYKKALGTQLGGYIYEPISPCFCMAITKKGEKDKLVRVLFRMVLNSKNTKETSFTTIIHELAHVYCGHLGKSFSEIWQDRSKLPDIEKEFEAESITWLICERMGIKNPSERYLSGYINKYEEIPDISMDAILKAVISIESIINSPKKLRDKLIIAEKDFSEEIWKFIDEED